MRVPLFLTPMPRQPRRFVGIPRGTDAALDAMRMADRLFAASSDVEGLLSNAAEALAREPGQLCVISLVGDDAELRPKVVAHAQRVQNILISPAQRGAGESDAFSRSVRRSRGSLRMRISHPDVLALWLPRAWLGYAARVCVSSVLAAALRHPRRGVLGTVLVWREGDQAAFANSDEAYVVAVAERLAHGLAAYLT